jgi:hypothetical protein
MINLPDNFTASVASSTTGMLSAFSNPLVLIISTLLMAVVIEIVISAIRHR